MEPPGNPVRFSDARLTKWRYLWPTRNGNLTTPQRRAPKPPRTSTVQVGQGSETTEFAMRLRGYRARGGATRM